MSAGNKQATPGPWSIRVKRAGLWNGAQIVGADGTHVASLTNKADKPIDQKQADAELIVKAVNKALGHG